MPSRFKPCDRAAISRSFKSMKQIEIDEIYRKTPQERIPWNVETPPAALVALLDGCVVTPCRTIDLGCGAGNYAIYLASRGFDVTGVDSAPTAIRLAKENAVKKRVVCTFLVDDVLGDLETVTGTFDFAYDWELLHHIFPDQRKRYVTNVHNLLSPKGKYLSLCFNEGDQAFGGVGKYRRTPLGTLLYFSSEDELRALFDPYFTILDIKTIEVCGKFASHLANYCFMEWKEADSRKATAHMDL
ncbi:MAG: class I SAM-dependent methyltransferase [Halobacteriota archaeon]